LQGSAATEFSRGRSFMLRLSQFSLNAAMKEWFKYVHVCKSY